MFGIPKAKKLILFDGVCNLCNSSVTKVIKNDTKNEFVFASLQSEIGEEIIKYLEIDISKIDSIILFNPKLSYDVKSSAALKIMNSFGGFWKLTQIFWIIPSPVRNIVYDFVAKNRYKWYGKRASCMLPSVEMKAKFL